MRSLILKCATLTVASFLAVTTALADAPKSTEADARAKIEAQVVAQAQAKCAKEGKVALAEHVKSTVMIKCVSADDPEYKAQQSAKPAP